MLLSLFHSFAYIFPLPTLLNVFYRFLFLHVIFLSFILYRTHLHLFFSNVLRKHANKMKKSINCILCCVLYLFICFFFFHFFSCLVLSSVCITVYFVVVRIICVSFPSLPGFNLIFIPNHISNFTSPPSLSPLLPSRVWARI